MAREKAKQAPVALEPVALDPTYELHLAGKDAWPLGHVASVAAKQPLEAAGPRSKTVGRSVWRSLSDAVESQRLPVVHCAEPVPARTVRDDRSDPLAPPLAFNKAHRTRTIPGRSFWHLATVRPSDAVAWLRVAGFADMAARVQRIADALVARRLHEEPEPGDWPANLSRCAPEVVARAIAAQWQRWQADGGPPKGAEGIIKAQLQACGFSSRAARELHKLHKPADYRQGPKPTARKSPAGGSGKGGKAGRKAPAKG